uniref:Reverse transcriptase domain-containing protein n=1 Tax=Cannabis sativa TaxID=3483 RepID=A0A803QZN5_CANSA
MEYLTRRFSMAASKTSFRYHPLCKSLKIVNLCFADDLILFSKGNIQSVQILKDIMNEFYATSGLAINTNKSQIYLGRVESKAKHEILREINLSEGKFSLKYLGIPLRPTKWKAEDCDVILKKIKQRLHSWASRHLSFAGRSQLIHSVLLGLRNYWMSIFILPQSITKEIENFC